jgi:hypothetical protein
MDTKYYQPWNESPDDWELWNSESPYRWIFNKLELALRCKHIAGPVPVLPPLDGYYIVRPIYNLFGMSIMAKKVWLNTYDNPVLMDNIHPGNFWCEWFAGNHYSIDFEWNKGWKPMFTTRGFNSDDEIWRWTKWIKVDYPDIKLPTFLDELKDNQILNIEFRGNHIVEVHLRLGNMNGDWNGLWEQNEIVPIWEDRLEEKDLLLNSGYKYIERREITGNRKEISRLGFCYR